MPDSAVRSTEHRAQQHRIADVRSSQLPTLERPRSRARRTSVRAVSALESDMKTKCLVCCC